MARNALAFEVPEQSHPDATKPGAYWFMYRWNTDVAPARITSQRIGIGHACPCGCGSQSAMWFEGSSEFHAGGPEWSVTGEWPKVTLSPSIGIRPKDAKGRYHWHGFLEAGIFVER